MEVDTADDTGTVATVTTGYWFGKQHQLQQIAASSTNTTSSNSTSSNSTSTSITSNISSSIVAQVEAEAGAVTHKADGVSDRAEKNVGGEAVMAVILREIWLFVPVNFVSSKQKTCSSMLIVLTDILMISGAIIPVITLPSHKACFAVRKLYRSL